MAALDIDFAWPCDPAGYRLMKNAPAGGDRIVPNRNMPIPPPNHVRLLEKFPQLFVTFVDTVRDPEGALRFVSQFGPFGWDGLDSTKGDLVHRMLMGASGMRQMLGLRPSDRRRASRRANVPDGPDLMPGKVTGQIVVDAHGKPHLRFAPDTLEDALWLQAAVELGNGVSVRQCRQCDALFAAGAGSGRRADAQYCCDDHRITYNSYLRSKEN
jgi:hypothetical protein